MTDGFTFWWNGAPVLTTGATGDLAYWWNGASVLQLPAAPAGSLAGTSAWVWGASGTLTGTGALAGQSTWTWGASGTLVAGQTLEGTSAWVWGAFGTLVDAAAPVSPWAPFPFHRAGPQNVRVPFLEFSTIPWKYRKVSPKGHRVYHLPY